MVKACGRAACWVSRGEETTLGANGPSIGGYLSLPLNHGGNRWHVVHLQGTLAQQDNHMSKGIPTELGTVGGMLKAGQQKSAS